MSISPRFLQDLRDRLTLSEVIGRRVKLTRSGREFKGCCPFHREKTPSFYVNDDKQFFHCFGCGAHGDVLGFVMRHDNLPFTEAIEALAAQAGLQVPRQTQEDVHQARQQKGLYDLCEEAAKWFETQLHIPSNREVLGYLTGRGIKPEIIDSFRLGYAPVEDQGLRVHLRGQGYTDAQMIEAGVVKPSTTGRESYSFFRDRVMFPVTDARGRIVAFGGRVLPDHLRPIRSSDHKPPKYINSAENPLFHKGQMLYAQQHARMAADKSPVIVVEGYMDVIACQQAGFRGAVAPLGTALTQEQILALWKMIPLDSKEPILCFDGDDAGYRAAVRAIDRILPLLKPSQSVRFAFLPQGDDPDTYIRENGAAAFAELLERSISLADFLWTHHTIGKVFSTPEAQAGLSQTLEGLAAQIPEAQLQYYYKQAFRDKTRALFGKSWAGKPMGRSPFKDNHKSSGGNASSVVLPPLSRQKTQGMIPQLLLLTLLNHPYLYPSVQDHFQQIETDSPEFRSLYDAALAYFEENEPETLDKEGATHHITSFGLAETLDRLRSDRFYVHAGFARPETEPELALAGWLSLWDQWDRSRLLVDIQAARAALRSSVTPENESRMLALQQIQREKDAGSA
ncbi:MAG: DNA primase [Alphaproteobacteria bacterium]|nr:DNA primase [Alphaproteobacteria bacterium]